jgi:hypothetical protein
MFDFGLSYKDWSRIVWTFVQGALAYMIAASAGWVPGDPWNWKAVLIGAIAAGASALKNFLLADGSPLK